MMRSLLAFLSMLTSFTATAGLFGIGNANWSEEVLLHDGTKIIVSRSQSYGGRHEIGQTPPVKEHTIQFELPGNRAMVKWTSEYGADLGRTNFTLLALHVLDGIPYLVAEPNLCLSYNKWGRPNPPYVFFKHDGHQWNRIPIEKFPTDFTTINLTIETKNIEEKLTRNEVVSIEKVRNFNKTLSQRQYKSILREPISGSECEELIKYKGYWVMPNDPVARGMVDRMVEKKGAK
jgi:hypothetical protein